MIINTGYFFKFLSTVLFMLSLNRFLLSVQRQLPISSMLPLIHLVNVQNKYCSESFTFSLTAMRHPLFNKPLYDQPIDLTMLQLLPMPNQSVIALSSIALVIASLAYAKPVYLTAI